MLSRLLMPRMVMHRVLGFGHNENALWLHAGHQSFCDLVSQLLLQLQSSGIDFHSPRQLAKAHYLTVGNISDMYLSKKGSMWCSQVE